MPQGADGPVASPEAQEVSYVKTCADRGGSQPKDFREWKDGDFCGDSKVTAVLRIFLHVSALGLLFRFRDDRFLNASNWQTLVAATEPWPILTSSQHAPARRTLLVAPQKRPISWPRAPSS